MRTAERDEAWQLTDGRCFYCREPLIPDGARAPAGGRGDIMRLQIDHKMPRSRGGLDIAENRVPACGWCNAQKHARTVEEYHDYLVSLGIIPCFMDKEPRQRDWLIVTTVQAMPRWRARIHHPHMRRSSE